MKNIKYTFGILIIIVLIKYFTSNYSINYVIKNYKVNEKVRDNYTYIDVNVDKDSYSFKYDLKRGLSKKRVKDINIIEKDNATCIKPVIKGFETYYICKKDGELVTENTLRTLEDIKFSEDIKYNKYLNRNEYLYIWKYDGFYTFNNEMGTLNLLSTDRYSNDLMYTFDKYLLMPVYDKEYMFSNFYLIDMETGKYKTIKTNLSIHYDSYYAGTHKNKIYLFDNKSNKLYEINYKKLTIKSVGDEFKGYIKYENNRKKTAKLSEYTKEKITYFETKEELIKVDKNKFSYDNKTWIKYFNEEDIKVIKVYNDSIYFIYQDNLYKYSNSKVNLIIHYFEYNFNKNDITYIYNK